MECYGIFSSTLGNIVLFWLENVQMYCLLLPHTTQSVEGHVPREGHWTSRGLSVHASSLALSVSHMTPDVIESRVHPVLSLKQGSILQWVYWKHELKRNRTLYQYYQTSVKVQLYSWQLTRMSIIKIPIHSVGWST